MGEPIDRSAWLVEHPAASYVMRVVGQCMSNYGIVDGDFIVVSRAKKRGEAMLSWPSCMATAT